MMNSRAWSRITHPQGAKSSSKEANPKHELEDQHFAVELKHTGSCALSTGGFDVHRNEARDDLERRRALDTEAAKKSQSDARAGITRK